MTFKKMIQETTFQRLRANWDQQQPLKGTAHEQDFVPVCRLYDPFSAAEWYVTEADEDGLAFGLAFIHEYELGYFDLGEIAELQIAGQQRIVQDDTFVPTMSLSQYAAVKKGGHF